MEENSKLWIFQSRRILTEQEEQNIAEMIETFLQSWAAHGKEMKSDYKILNHKFIVITADENHTKATGCSMDSLNRLARDINAEYDLDLLNRLWISYETAEKDIKTILLNEFKQSVKNGLFDLNTIIYNLSVSSAKEFNEKFKQPLHQSWAKIYLN
ncbi:MAG: hypothetical protein LBT29_02640 [Flavobacteriaceae bacterium]|jgi:hypothetical protein|nr:hypothetical protein [Flavobacteriaceae bacterium]